MNSRVELARQMARRRHRETVEGEYDGKCTVYGYGKVTDDETKLTRKNVEIIVAEDVPCHLSYSSKNVADADGITVSRQQSIRLFMAPEVSVKAGSKVVVTQNGVTAVYKNSGEPAIYPSHQEIELELYKEKA